jgi:NMD protein affecting ribosome stability and mRNA decay
MEFCPGCGKKSKSICKDCKPEREIKTKDINLKLCCFCDKYFFNNKWVAYNDLNLVIKKVATESVKESEKFSVKPNLPEFKINPGVNVEFDIKISFVDDEFIIPANIEVTYCNNCAKQQGDYFDGILQLRNIDKEIKEFVEDYLIENKIFSPKQTKLKNGYDIKITDQRKIQKLGQILQNTYGGILKINAEHFSQDRQTSKYVYRVNIYFEPLDFRVGQAIKINNRVILVKKIGKSISGIDLTIDKNTTIKLEKEEYEILKTKKTTVSKIHPHIEILDPDTYQTVPTQNQKKLKIGQKVKVIDDNGLFYII